MNISQCIPILYIYIYNCSAPIKRQINRKKTNRVEKGSQGRGRMGEKGIVPRIEMEKTAFICSYEYVKMNPTIMYYNALKIKKNKIKNQ